MDGSGDGGDKRDVRRPMNAFLIFCKRHRSIVREKNPDLDNRSVTRILGDLWANLKEEEKVVYTDLAKQYKDAFMKANPDYKWHNPEKTLGSQKSGLPLTKPTNAKVVRTEMNLLPEGSIIPGKLADPNNMGGLSLLLMAGEQSGPVPVGIKPLSSATVPRSVEMSFATLPRSPELTSFPTCTLPNNMTPGNTSLNSGDRLAVFRDNKPLNLMEDKLENRQVVADNVLHLEDSKSNWKLEEAAVKSVMQLKHSGVEKTWENFLPSKSGSLDILAKTGDTDAQPVKSVETFSSKPLLYQAVAAPKMPQRSLLAEAFKDKFDIGGFPDILRDNLSSTKMANFENQGKLLEDQINMLEQKLINKVDEKENFTKNFTNPIKSSDEIKQEPKDISEMEEESAMVTCGKLVVNHIIDKLYSSDLGAGARRGNNNSDEVDGERKDDEKVNCEKTEQEIKTESCEERYDIVDDGHKNEVKVKVKEKVVEAVDAVSKAGSYGFDVGEKVTKIEKGDTNDSEKSVDENSLDCKSLTKKSGKRQTAPTADSTEYESEEIDEFQPVRKSRRRNRGQRYQELINEGIIQRSKERTAALQQTTPKEESTEEDIHPIEPLNSYILPETAIRRIRKRTTSESAKDKMLHPDDVKRYKTGDFDLEAQIATLPACSVENMGRKRGFARQRHYSECTLTQRKMVDCETSPHSVPAFDIDKAVSLPPHIKLPSPETSKEPVTGSRKRKARKHSITHMIPAPPTLMKNGKVKTDGDSLGPCLIKPTVEMLKDETDYSEKGPSVPITKTDYIENGFVAPANRSRSCSDVSEKFSDRSKCEVLKNRLLFNKNKNSLSESEVVGDKITTNAQETELSKCLNENKNKTGSVLCESREKSLIHKVVIQSDETLKNLSGAEMNTSVPKTVLQDKQQCEISEVTDFNNTAEKLAENGNTVRMENQPDRENFVSKQSEQFVLGSDSFHFEQSKVRKEKSVNDLLKTGKDVNSNTTMNS
ncbi:HMG box transcription factor BBX-like isoform X2 [Mercenaria mercenaria]|nr:HMG box transcription factor BBX-like isoform X2 [Mercenaria mercenaria]XP_053409337.1 HMG box transcription factor BBX-like isoform X2 [Mercenaria mercenaria]XP_053409338.1 HMG box transcription factor BBX-like isoform X2 [Mercenaria mercenaria]XP_053409339.1 HMG box transcription factor BBX-like isoform X2 [Mercenaria mercenaria]